MKFGSVCSGIEAASVAWGSLGWKASWFSEIEPFPCAVLKHHYPHIPNHGDMTGIASRVLNKEIEAPEVLCGGTPCQAFSVAGLRKSLEDDRGNLSLEFCRIATAIDTSRAESGQEPAIIFWENVPGVLNTKDNAFGCFLGELAGESVPLIPSGGRWTDAGCVFGPKRAVAWRVFDAQHFGLAQRRKRVFVIASAREGFNPAEVLFEFEGVRRDFAPSREAGEKVAPTVTGGAPFSRTGNERVETDAIILAHVHPSSVGNTHTARMVAFGEYVEDGTASTMKARDYKDATDLVITPNAYALQGNMIGRNDKAGPQGSGVGEEICFTQTKTDVHAVAYHDERAMVLMDQGGSVMNVEHEISGTLRRETHGHEPCVLNQSAMRVRRLTPTECERLQGFPDGYTAIPWKGKETPDSLRYKALGNSWAVPVVRWIGERIKRRANDD